MGFVMPKSGCCFIGKLGHDRFIWAYMIVKITREAYDSKIWFELTQRRALSVMVMVL